MVGFFKTIPLFFEMDAVAKTQFYRSGRTDSKHQDHHGQDNAIHPVIHLCFHRDGSPYVSDILLSGVAPSIQEMVKAKRGVIATDDHFVPAFNQFFALVIAAFVMSTDNLFGPSRCNHT